MNELLEQIEYNNSVFPEAQLKEIISRKEELIPELLEILKYTRKNYEELIEEYDYFAPTYALFLLAQFKEKLSFPLIIDLVSLPDEVPHDLFGDLITEDLFKILASVCDGNIEPIKKLIENESIDEYVRNAGINSFLVLLAEGVISRNEVIEYFKTLFAGRLERKSSVVWGSIVSASCKIGAVELQEYIKKAFKDDLVDRFYISLEDVDYHVKLNDKLGLSLLDDEQYRFITDTVEHLRFWACFNEKTVTPRYTVENANKKKDKNKTKSKRKQIKTSKKKQRKK
jgi:hypothetical protein